MSLLKKIKDYFAQKKLKRIERAGKLVTNAKAIREDRWAALEFLAEDVTEPEQAIPHLLQRFEYSLEHGINDTREKELALTGIVRFGDASVPFLKDRLKQTSRIAWPIKVLNALGKDDEVINCLKGALNFGDIAFDQAAVDKNYDILCYLREYQLADVAIQITHFLKDQDERVRYAAAELLIAQQTDALREHLEPFLKDDSSENRRIRQVVIKAFIDRGWQLGKPEEFPQGHVVEGVFVGPKGTLELRG